jgi:hypothetical protein
MSHDHVAEFSKQATLERFRKKICQHLFSRTMLDVDVFQANPVLDEKISDVNVSGIRAARFSAVPLEPDGALVVLIKDVFL